MRPAWEQLSCVSGEMPPARAEVAGGRFACTPRAHQWFSFIWVVFNGQKARRRLLHLIPA